MDFFQFHKKKLDYLYRCYRHPTPKMPKLTLGLPPGRWESRALDSDCSGNIARFRWISSNFIKLIYLDRCNHNPAAKMSKLTLCLPCARWGPRALDSRCSGSIASFGWISSNLIKTRLFTDLIVIWHLQCQNQPYVSHLLAEDPGPLIPGAVAILPDFDGLRFVKTRPFIQI